MNHTKEPWQFRLYSPYSSSGVGKYAIYDAVQHSYGYAPLAVVRGDKRVTGGNGGFNVRRIVACVNACEGIPTKKLELMAEGIAERKAQLKAEREA